MISIQRQRLQALRPKGYLWRNNNRGQSNLEYAFIIVCIGASLLVMQPYIKKAFQGRLRQQADELGQQYEPGKTSGKLTIVNDSKTSTISKTYDEVKIKELDGRLDINGDGTMDFEDVDPDLNGNEKWENDVSATFTMSILEKGEVTQDGTETIKP